MPIFNSNTLSASRKKKNDITREKAKTIYGGYSKRGVWRETSFGWGTEATRFKVINSRFKGKLLQAVEQAANSGGRSVLDLGCGKLTAMNFLAKKFPRLNFFGISRDHYPIYERIKKPNMDVLVSDWVTALTFLEKKKIFFDVVYVHWAMSHLAKGDLMPIKQISELKRVLNIGGKIFIHPALGHLSKKFEPGLNQNGFEVETVDVPNGSLILTRVK